MTNLANIDDKFVDEYIFNHRNNLSKTDVGGTDWRFADIVAPAFKEILEIANPSSVMEIGFNKGSSALMFLSINPTLQYHSIDIIRREKSVEFLKKEFKHFWFVEEDSRNIKPGHGSILLEKYDMVFIDGEHSREGVINDIEKSLLFNPKYILLDDVLHGSHQYIYEIITQNYAGVLELIKLYEFNQCWKGYSMALCKVKTGI